MSKRKKRTRNKSVAPGKAGAGAAAKLTDKAKRASKSPGTDEASGQTPTKPSSESSVAPESHSEAQPEDSQPALEPRPPSAWSRLDLWVVVIAALLIGLSSYIYRGLSKPGSTEFRMGGLSFMRPNGFLPPSPVPRETTALASAFETAPLLAPADAGAAEPANSGDAKKKGQAKSLGNSGVKAGDKSTDVAPPTPPPIVLPQPPENRYHVIYQAPTDPLLRLEVRIEDQPVYNNLVGALSIYRSGRYGDTYWASDSRITNIAGRDWTRTEFSYAYKAGLGDSPSVANAIEYASLNAGEVFVVTFHGTREQTAELAELIAPTLTLRAASPPQSP